MSTLPHSDAQNSFESSARYYPRVLPLAIDTAMGSWIQATNGKSYLDFLAGAGTLALGHNHPEVVESLNRTIRRGAPLHTLDFLTEEKQAMVQELHKVLPAELGPRGKIHFCGPTGTDGVEAALKLARRATGRQGVVAFTGAYHGMSAGSAAVSGAPTMRTGVPVEAQPTIRLPLPKDDKHGRAVMSLLADLVDDPKGGVLLPAAVIIEPIQGEGGVNVVPDAFLSSLRKFTKTRSIVLICDEIQCGVGRSGRMWASEYAKIVPDVLVMSKAIGGSLPLALIAYREFLDTWPPGSHTGTFRGTTLAMAAGSTTLRIIRTERLVERAAEKGKQLLNHFGDLVDAGYAADIRGRGLMIGINAGTTATAEKVRDHCFSKGLMLETGGPTGEVIRLLPPLNTSDEEFDLAVGIIDEAFQLHGRPNSKGV